MRHFLLCAFVVFGGVLSLSGCVKDGGKDHLVYYLKKPLRVEVVAPGPGQKARYELPPGTALYLEGHKGGEAFERYKVYINVEGGPLKGERSKHPGEINPLIGSLHEPR